MTPVVLHSMASSPGLPVWLQISHRVACCQLQTVHQKIGVLSVYVLAGGPRRRLKDAAYGSNSVSVDAGLWLPVTSGQFGVVF